MKHFLLINIILVAFNTSAQTLHYADIENGTAKKTVYYGTYFAKNGERFDVGDKITIGKPSHLAGFMYIEQGDPILGGGLDPAERQSEGLVVEMKYVQIYGTKGSGLYAVMRTKGGLFGFNIQIENAIESGEIISSVMTSDQALAEMKKAKEKLDLELITQTEYDSIKAVLIKFIK